MQYGGWRRIARWTGWAALWLPLVLSGGCLTGDPTTRDDINSIHPYFSSLPWIWNAEGRVRGMVTRAYFVSTQTGKGAFVPRPINVALYSLAPRPDGTYERTLVYEWTFGKAQADDFRVTHASGMGDSYGLVLTWPSEVDVAGHEIQLDFTYQRADGTTIQRRGPRFIVPAAGARPASQPVTVQSRRTTTGPAPPVTRPR